MDITITLIVSIDVGIVITTATKRPPKPLNSQNDDKFLVLTESK